MTTQSSTPFFLRGKQIMILINNGLAITNGDEFKPNHLSGQYANGTVYHLHVLEYGTRLVIETGKLVEDTSDEGILNAIDNGKLDIFPLTTYGGKNSVIGLLKSINRRLENIRRIKEYNEKLAKLSAKYPQIPAELLQELKNHDWYFEFSDDISVYRAGNAHKKELLAKLKEINAEDYYHEYLKL